MNLRGTLLAAAGAAALTACGGGDSGGGAPPTGGGAPPTGGGGGPAPTPTPTPTFSYTKYVDLEGDQNYYSACVGAGPILRGVAVGDAPPSSLGIQVFGQDGLVTFTEATETWQVAIPNGQSESFGPADLQASTGPLIIYQRSDDGDLEVLEIETLGSASTLREYSRELFFSLADTTARLGTAYCSIGVPSEPDDLPDSTTVTYSNFDIEGAYYQQVGSSVESRRITGGSATVTGNTDTGEVAVDLSLEVEITGGGSQVFGPYSGTLTASVDTDRVGYFGQLNLGGIPEFTLSGAFYGPQGTETSFVFAADVDQDSDRFNEQFFVGRASAKR